jgi:hypothetical protein
MKITKTENFYVVTVLNYNNDGIANFSAYTLLSALASAYDYKLK